MARYPRRKRSSKPSLKSAWKAKRKKPKTSALVRQTEANRKAIEKLKEEREVKYERNLVAKPTNGYVGQILPLTKVDAYGLTQDSLDWATLNPFSSYLTNINLYSPLWVCPTACGPQGVTAGQRIGDDVVMRSLNIKGAVVAGSSFGNGGDYQGLPQKQCVHMYVLLDTSPPPENTSNALQLASIPAQTFQYEPAWNNLIGLATNTTGTNIPPANLFKGTRDHLKTISYSAKNPPGIATQPTSKNMLNLSFWSKDEGGIGVTERFKVLKHKKYYCTQSQQGPNVPTSNASTIGAAKSVVDINETIKGNYKFHFPNNSSTLSDNRAIWLAFVSETPTLRWQGTTTSPPSDYISAPRVTLQCSFNYVDP